MDEKETLKIVEDYCKEKRWKIVKNFHCSCLLYCNPIITPGYKGKGDLDCGNCAEECPRCLEFSNCISYSSTGISDKYTDVCYGCAIGDNYSYDR